MNEYTTKSINSLINWNRKVMVYENLSGTIGNTPLVRLNKITAGLTGTYYAKVEAFNPGQSAKDRIAFYMVEQAEKKGLIKPGGTIVEATSGNTGFSIAMLSAIKGYKCILTLTSKASTEKISLLKSLGAEVVICPVDVSPEDPRSYYSRAEQIAKETPNASKALCALTLWASLISYSFIS